MRFIDFVPGCSAKELVINETEQPKLKAGEVLIKVVAFGINRADLLQREGKYPAPKGESEILGLEVAGEVIQLSDSFNQVKCRFKLGDKVFGLVAGGGYAEYVAVNAEHLLLQPPSMTSVEAAGVAECFLTAYQSMFVEYHLTTKQSVLIHAGASGVGLAAIQLAKQLDCLVAVTASSTTKLAECQKLGADILINYRQENFSDALKSKGISVDLVIDFVGGDYVNRNLSVLKQDGCIIQLAILGGRYADNIDMGLLLGKRAILKGSTLRNRSNDYKSALIAAFEKNYWQSLQQQQIQPVIDHAYAVSDIAQAHERMENNRNIGKLVCRW